MKICKLPQKEGEVYLVLNLNRKSGVKGFYLLISFEITLKIWQVNQKLNCSQRTSIYNNNNNALCIPNYINLLQNLPQTILTVNTGLYFQVHTDMLILYFD